MSKEKTKTATNLVGANCVRPHFGGKTQKGITLIALIITIIVMLILVGVTVSVSLNGGLFSTAQKATEDYNQEVLNEKYYFGKVEDILAEYETGIVVEQVTDTASGVLEGSGTEADPYVINSIEDLVFFSYDVRQGNTYTEKYVKLGLDLDFNSTKSYVEAYRTDYAEYGYDGELKTLLTSGEGFIPIGSLNANSSDNFCGTFDGNGNSISNLYCNVIYDETDDMRIGFFPYTRGTIKNLKLLNVNMYLEALNAKGLIGGICGHNSSVGIITNCIVSGNIVSNVMHGCAAGIAAYSPGSIQYCGNLSNVSIEIVGENLNGTTLIDVRRSLWRW